MVKLFYRIINSKLTWVFFVAFGVGMLIGSAFCDDVESALFCSICACICIMNGLLNLIYVGIIEQIDYRFSQLKELIQKENTEES